MDKFQLLATQHMDAINKFAENTPIQTIKELANKLLDSYNRHEPIDEFSFWLSKLYEEIEYNSESINTDDYNDVCGDIMQLTYI